MPGSSYTSVTICNHTLSHHLLLTRLYPHPQKNFSAEAKARLADYATRYGKASINLKRTLDEDVEFSWGSVKNPDSCPGPNHAYTKPESLLHAKTTPSLARHACRWKLMKTLAGSSHNLGCNPTTRAKLGYRRCSYTSTCEVQPSSCTHEVPSQPTYTDSMHCVASRV